MFTIWSKLSIQNAKQGWCVFHNIKLAKRFPHRVKRGGKYALRYTPTTIFLVALTTKKALVSHQFRQPHPRWQKCRNAWNMTLLSFHFVSEAILIRRPSDKMRFCLILRGTERRGDCTTNICFPWLISRLSRPFCQAEKKQRVGSSANSRFLGPHKWCLLSFDNRRLQKLVHDINWMPRRNKKQKTKSGTIKIVVRNIDFLWAKQQNRTGRSCIWLGHRGNERESRKDNATTENHKVNTTSVSKCLQRNLRLNGVVYHRRVFERV